MIIKVCGIKTKENIDFLSEVDVDMVGLNFYKPSVRYIEDESVKDNFDKLPKKIKRVGVFVNEEKDFILQKTNHFNLDYVQLHGDEDSEYCEAMSNHIPVIKVFRIDPEFNFTKTNDFESASFFLFDTQTKHYGGSGLKFNWSELDNYGGKKPFLLSGGIGPNDVRQLQMLNHPSFKGIDINSKFESSPGIKDHSILLTFINKLRDEK